MSGEGGRWKLIGNCFLIKGQIKCETVSYTDFLLYLILSYDAKKEKQNQQTKKQPP